MPTSALDYWQQIQHAGDLYGVDPRLIAGVIQTESSGRPGVVSTAGAIGLGQLMPATAQALGVVNPYDAQQNIAGTAQLLRQDLDRYGNTQDALMAYHGGTDTGNWGPLTQSYPGKVKASIAKLFGNGDFVPPADGTQNAGATQKVDFVMAPNGALIDPKTGQQLTAPIYSFGAGPKAGLDNAGKIDRWLADTVGGWFGSDDGAKQVDSFMGGSIPNNPTTGKPYDVKPMKETSLMDKLNPFDNIGNVLLRMVVILAAIGIVGLGLYFMFKKQIDSTIGAVVGAAAKVAV